MRRRLTFAVVLGVAAILIAAGIASARSSVIFIVGNVEITVKGGFSPTKLPKNRLAPIHLQASGTINALDGTRPPALKEVVLETDKNGTINAKGLPACKASRIKATTTEVALKLCKSTLVGKGETTVEVQFPEQHAFLTKSELLAFNGGVKGGVTTILIHAFLKSPVSAAVVTTVKVSKIHSGRYGIKSVAKIPVIAGGSGSVKSFNLKFFRAFTYRHKKQSYLLAKCPDGKLKARTKLFFAEGVETPIGALSFPCTPKG